MHKNKNNSENYLNPVRLIGTHWIALTEYSQMSTHLPGFQSFLKFFALFCIGQISHQQHKGQQYGWPEMGHFRGQASGTLPFGKSFSMPGDLLWY